MGERIESISTHPIEFLQEEANCRCGATVELHIDHKKGHEKRYDGHLMGQPNFTDDLRPCPYVGTLVST